MNCKYIILIVYTLGLKKTVRRWWIYYF